MSGPPEWRTSPSVRARSAWSGRSTGGVTGDTLPGRVTIVKGSRSLGDRSWTRRAHRFPCGETAAVQAMRPRPGRLAELDLELDVAIADLKPADAAHGALAG